MKENAALTGAAHLGWLLQDDTSRGGRGQDSRPQMRRLYLLGHGDRKPSYRKLTLELSGRC